MLRSLLLLALCWPAAADDVPLPPLSQGTFQEWIGSDSAGSFLFQTSDQKSHRCVFSSRTYFEREHKRTFVSRIPPGQALEVLSERIPEPPRCRALIVRVITPQVASPNRYRSRAPQAATEFFLNRGTLQLTGVVVRADETLLLLRTRAGAQHWVRLRGDTRFSENGFHADRARLPSNHPIHIRAGTNFEGEIEAYSIVWGRILRPD
jgi:hypothetical protein